MTANEHTTLEKLALLAAAIRAYDQTHRLRTCDTCGAAWDPTEDADCRWCAARRQADIDHLLTPPEPSGRGYATATDLRRLGINPTVEYDAQLRAWVDDLRAAVDTGLITRRQKNDAIRRARARTRHRPHHTA